MYWAFSEAKVASLNKVYKSKNENTESFIRLCYLVTNKVKPRNKSDSQVKQLLLITNLNVHLK